MGRRCRVGAGEKGGSLTGPNPADRGKKGSKLHVLSKAQGLPLAVAVSGVNVHDSQAFKPSIPGIPAVRSRRGPRRRKPVKVRADKAYYSAEHLRRLRSQHLIARIARPGIEAGERFGRRRWKIERSISWLFGYRRPTVRYERKGSHFVAFLSLAGPHLLQEARETHHVRPAPHRALVCSQGPSRGLGGMQPLSARRSDGDHGYPRGRAA
ncbi:transposase [Streptomyces sp. NPDC048142]|uniref:transposase n=1 Tax=Streptomyces sp. NPDC048142 TaxID=3365501 RepID=UPI00371B3C04